jgi:hypothetical protein
VACDNVSALRHCMDSERYPLIAGNTPDFDIVHTVRRGILPGILYKWKHVKGNQDQTTHTLNWWDQLNIHVDNQATQRRKMILQHNAIKDWHAALPHERLKIYLGDN